MKPVECIVLLMAFATFCLADALFLSFVNQLVWKSKKESMRCIHNTKDKDTSRIKVIHCYKDEKNSYDFNQVEDLIVNTKRWNEKLKCILFVPGFDEDVNSIEIKLLIDAIIKNNPDTHVWFIDTSHYTMSHGKFYKNYITAVASAPKISLAIAQWLLKCIEGGMILENIHCLGISLGCQILSETGRQFKEISGGEQIQRITGLDPAGPCFDDTKFKYQLKSSDAKFVDILHSNAGNFGTATRMGTVDFMADGEGLRAEQCKKYMLYGEPLHSMCCHVFSILVWIETLENNYSMQATQCNSFDDYVAGSCSGNHQTYVGPACSINATGQYFYYSTGIKKIDAFINGTGQTLPEEVSAEMAPNFKFCPVTSVDVEWSFSAYKLY